MKKVSQRLIYATSLIALAAVGCGSSPSSSTAGLGSYPLTVTSVNPVSGLALTVSPADVNGAGSAGSQALETSLSLIYNSGAAVTLTAPATNAAGNIFYAWVGCDSTSGYICNVAMNKSKSALVEYAGVSSLVINPSSISVAAGGGVQVPLTVNGYGMCSEPSLTPGGPPTQVECTSSLVTYSVYASSTGNAGTITQYGGYYTPASSSPASTIVVTAQSAVSPNIIATGLITLQQ